MNFDEIPLRMMKLGVDRAWLAQQCDYSPQHMSNILAPNADVKSKTQKALRRIWEALDREEARQQNPVIPLELHQVVLRATDEEFTNWNRKALDEKMLIKDWCIKSLNEAAANILAGKFDGILQLGVTQKSVIELPLLRAAAGAPILSDAEMVEVDQDHGVGRFVLELRGDSMEPNFRNRQRIIMREKSALKRPVLKYGEFYAFIVDGLVTFKQWAKDKAGDKVLRSLNPEHADIIADEHTDWIGWYDAKDNA